MTAEVCNPLKSKVFCFFFSKKKRLPPACPTYVTNVKFYAAFITSGQSSHRAFTRPAPNHRLVMPEEAGDGGCVGDCAGDGGHPADGCLCRALRADLMLDLILGGAVSSLLLVYLVWALVRPEDF
jgi:K+-transporting ATPase KdpF subunit